MDNNIYVIYLTKLEEVPSILYCEIETIDVQNEWI